MKRKTAKDRETILKVSGVSASVGKISLSMYANARVERGEKLKD